MLQPSFRCRVLPVAGGELVAQGSFFKPCGSSIFLGDEETPLKSRRARDQALDAE